MLFLFSDLPRAMVSTLVSVPWGLLLFVCLRVCAVMKDLFSFDFFVHMGKHGCGGFTLCTLCMHGDIF